MTPRLVRSMARLPRALVLTGLLATAGPVALRAQGPSGTIEGQVRDTGGAAVAHARLRLTGTPYATVADSLGRYRFPALRPAIYHLRVTYLGYAPAAVDSVKVQPGRTTVVDVALVPVGVEIQEMTVVAAANAQQPTRWRRTAMPTPGGLRDRAAAAAAATNRARRRRRRCVRRRWRRRPCVGRRKRPHSAECCAAGRRRRAAPRLAASWRPTTRQAVGRVAMRRRACPAPTQPPKCR